MKLLLILVAGVLVSGCARASMQNPPPRPPPAPARDVAPAPAPAVEPAGVWDYTADAQGETISGTIELTRVDGRWGGRMTSSVLPDAPITAVTVQNQVVTATASIAGQGEVTVQMTITGNEFAGTWSLGGDSGPIRGSRR